MPRSTASRQCGLWVDSGPSTSPGNGPIGAIMTPLPWARWVVDHSHALEILRGGGEVLEPTCGDGAFVDALIEAGLATGMEPERVLRQVWAVERDARLVEQTRCRLLARWGLHLPDGHLVTADILDWAPPRRFAAAIGNPPWVTFADLPDSYKAFARARFIALGLVAEPRRLLLGASRADLSAVVVQRVLADMLSPHGCATFLLPLSLLGNDGANNRFRRLSTPSGSVALESVHDLTAHNIFAGAATTRYGAVSFRHGSPTTWPVPMVVHSPAGPRAESLVQGADLEAPLREANGMGTMDLPRVVVPAGCVPRQGVNTGGANVVFFVENMGRAGAGGVRVRDGTGSVATIPCRFLFPVATPATFREQKKPERWVVLPYDRATGRPLRSLEGTGLEDFFALHKQLLTKRKGTMLQATIGRGRWWAMLGVGPYCFADWRVIWEAYGRRQFVPRVLGAVDGQPWQANQALQAFIPVHNEATAHAIANQLANPAVEAWLRAHGAAGTMNWAQPGRIKRILEVAVPA